MVLVILSREIVSAAASATEVAAISIPACDVLVDRLISKIPDVPVLVVEEPSTRTRLEAPSVKVPLPDTSTESPIVTLPVESDNVPCRS